MKTVTNYVRNIVKMDIRNYVLPSAEYNFISTFFLLDSLCVHASARARMCVLNTSDQNMVISIIGNKFTKIMFKNSVPIFISK
jgi:hypothetical protein